MNPRRTKTPVFFIFFTVLFLTLVSFSLFSQGKAEKSNESDRYLHIFQYVYNFVQNNYIDDVDPHLLYEGALKGMLEALDDPYTSYIDTTSLMGTNLKDTTSGSFGGVGLSISKPVASTPEKPAWVEVASPIEDTPGWKAGIQPGDYLIEIEGISTPDITMEEVLNLLRGPVGTDVSVKVKRGTHLVFTVTLTRAIIEVPTVKYEMMDNGIGYLRIIEFTPLTAERVQEALDKFEKASYSGLIVDLRNNPGGLITSVIDVANKFIGSGVIVSTKSRISFENRNFRASAYKKTFNDNVPIVVLINKGSASASEILAGALKDHHLGYIIGETSFGKGSVQQVMDLYNNDAMKITIARYYTPSNANIDATGIIPDREILFPSLTSDDEKLLSELLESESIYKYFEDNKNPKQSEINNFTNNLYKKYPVEKRLLKKLVMQEYYRTRISPLYDLDYDIQLVEAINCLKNENVFELLKHTKTVKEMQALAEGVSLDTLRNKIEEDSAIDLLVPAF